MRGVMNLGLISLVCCALMIPAFSIDDEPQSGGDSGGGTDPVEPSPAPTTESNDAGSGQNAEGSVTNDSELDGENSDDALAGEGDEDESDDGA